MPINLGTGVSWTLCHELINFCSLERAGSEMKVRVTVALLSLLLFPLATLAQSELTAVWDVTGLEVSNVASVEFDVHLGSNYYALHGAFTSVNNVSMPSTGTCFVTSSGGVACNVTMGSQNSVLDIDPDLNGTITVFDALGELLETGSLTFRAQE